MNDKESIGTVLFCFVIGVLLGLTGGLVISIKETGEYKELLCTEIYTDTSKYKECKSKPLIKTIEDLINVRTDM